MSYRDIDLDQTMPNVELVRAIFIYNNMFKFQVDWTSIFLSYRVHRQTHTDTDKHEYSIVALINHNYNNLCLCLK